ncbi:Homogentisate 1,2-dioxygenase [Terfezia boudieri ATCC MYA-4762]|uniref:homogentisate 1,2-dioxygenase n=1 Tax=Terfezia boudieri ATCC MYA-4762 TaxID=1051890 RepID=A0A3N4LHY7_9PEZI|nr:Homogentisate 1,2-dioxygenase [Terfezia boudieri ATCC MYA-4762]
MCWKDPAGSDPYEYQVGFNNHFSVTHPSAPGALPTRGNNPQKAPYGLYTEQLSGTAFTVPRHLSQRTWLYRIRPSVSHTPFKPVPHPHIISSFTNLDDSRLYPTPTQLRWDPFDLDDEKANWVEGLQTVAGAGETQTKMGLAIHVYGFGRDMVDESFYNSDGDMLIVPVVGTLDIVTEFGKLWVPPGEICVLPRGIKFSVKRGPLVETNCRDMPSGWKGYILETFSALHFTLPDLGPIGANGLANPQDFKYPVPWFEDKDYGASTPSRSSHFTIINKFLGKIYHATQNHSPYNVVAYNGNYLPYKYPLSEFSPVGSISHDHPDPSIFTVLSLPNPATPGTALADFVLFPPRWLVAERTFRPPYFHRNVMTEFMVNIKGEYDAKDAGQGGFVPGGASLHSMNAAHGPDRATYEKELARQDGPKKVGDGSLAIMFETSLQLVPTKWAVEGCGKRQMAYSEVWEGFEVSWRKEKPEGA